jgi:hypothetical protein
MREGLIAIKRIKGRSRRSWGLAARSSKVFILGRNEGNNPPQRSGQLCPLKRTRSPIQQITRDTPRSKRILNRHFSSFISLHVVLSDPFSPQRIDFMRAQLYAERVCAGKKFSVALIVTSGLNGYTVTGVSSLLSRDAKFSLLMQHVTSPTRSAGVDGLREPFFSNYAH